MTTMQLTNQIHEHMTTTSFENHVVKEDDDDDDDTQLTVYKKQTWHKLD